MNFFLIGIRFEQSEASDESRLRKVMNQLLQRFPQLEGRMASLDCFKAPSQGLMIFPDSNNPVLREEIEQALAELGYQITVHHLSSDSDSTAATTSVDPESLRLLESGKSFCRIGLLEEARIQLQQAIQRDHSCLEAYHYLTAVLRRQDKSKEAAHWLRLALEHNPPEASLHFLYAELLCEYNRLDEAVEHLKQAIRLKPEASSPYVKLGDVFLRLGQADQARLAFEEGLGRDPKSADAAAGLGSLALGEGRLSQAIEYLQKAVQENEHLDEARLQLGWCLFHTGKPHQAEVEFLKVARDGQGQCGLAAQFSLGRLYAYLGDHRLAVDLLEEVLRAQPELAEAHQLLGQSLSELGKHTEALEHWDSAIRLQPYRESGLRQHLALCHSRLEQHQEAERLARLALEEQGPRAELYELLSSVYMAQDKWELALSTLRKGEILEPDSGLVAFQIGWCYENLGQSQMAEEFYGRALRLDPSQIEAYTGLGWLYYERAQYDVALVLFEKAHELDPKNPETADHVGWVHLLLKQPSLALEYFQQALQLEPFSYFYRTHMAAALFHLGLYPECQNTLESLAGEPLDDFLRTFSDYLIYQVRQQLGQPSRAISSRRLKLLPEEFVALTTSKTNPDRSRSRSGKWTEFRSKKGESSPSRKTSSS